MTTRPGPHQTARAGRGGDPLVRNAPFLHLGARRWFILRLPTIYLTPTEYAQATYADLHRLLGAAPLKRRP